MKTLYFMDMYYPSDTQELRQYCSVTPRDCHTPSLILLPHSSLEFIHGMYQDAFSQIHNPRRIVVMAPVHGQKFEDDASSSLFTFSTEHAVYKAVGAQEVFVVSQKLRTAQCHHATG